MNLLSGGLVPLEGFVAPGIKDFQFEGLWGTDWLTKPMLQLVVAGIVVAVFFLVVSRNLKVVPGKLQFSAEYLYNFIRNGVAREIIGPDYRKYSPYLVSVFFFVLLNNWFGEFFFFMFPSFANVGYAYGIALLSVAVFVGAGIQKHGFKYAKVALIPPGTPLILATIISPIEILSNFFTRPLTLAIRLFANMFAGHLAVLVFVVGGAFLLTYPNNLIFNLSGAFSLFGGVVMCLLELFLGGLQAYIFTILNAQYISTSIAESH